MATSDEASTESSIGSSEESWQPILDALGQVRSAWPAAEWTWDPRFKCVASSFATDMAAAARGALTPAVPSEWTPAKFANAPDDIRALEARCGDLRAGQLLMTANPVDGMMLFGMWWPWGDGSQVSVRLGVANCTRTKELYPLIRAVFGIA
jgi:hypothetical protein